MVLNDLLRLKRYKEALSECQEIFAEAKINDDQSALLTALVYTIIIYTRQEKYSESKKVLDDNYKSILSECPEFWDGKELIDTYLYFNELEKANEYINAFLEHNPNDYKSLFRKGNVLFLKKDFQSAITILLSLYKIDKYDSKLTYTIGLVLSQMDKKPEAFKFFETSFDHGNNNAINELVKLLFKREGICDYENCSDCCCKNVILSGVDNKSITTEESLLALIQKDDRNKCWIKHKENQKGAWVFNCKEHGVNNYCNNYENRPDVCIDYPSSILNIRQACSYKFLLKENPIKFSSANCLKVVLHFLKSYKYLNEMQELMKLNKNLLD